LKRQGSPIAAGIGKGEIWVETALRVTGAPDTGAIDGVVATARDMTGEEFVLLLPNTDAEDCERIGERVRQAVHDLAMPHALSPPSEHVTVSLGRATDLPAGGAADHSSLIEAADLALYTAKDGGRDRLIMSAQVIAWPKAKIA
jgi:predicted signal transduction protein with EAL and GGDEF domain